MLKIYRTSEVKVSIVYSRGWTYSQLLKLLSYQRLHKVTYTITRTQQHLNIDLSYKNDLFNTSSKSAKKKYKLFETVL